MSASARASRSSVSNVSSRRRRVWRIFCEDSWSCQKSEPAILFSIAENSRRLAGASKKTPEFGCPVLQLFEFSFQFFNHDFSLTDPEAALFRLLISVFPGCARQGLQP